MKVKEVYEAVGYQLKMYADDSGAIIHAPLRFNGKFLFCFNNGYDAYDFFAGIDPENF